ncbi:carotenoid biosynthesis protein [uncultured Massilia sp.]|uniref:carotenoid biosynthesis protein n=1 Tax=uncultured Massilia sp. TaxID=169973 RepID=UPI0025F5F732|nr:carotenoid biosynthesis protein [uncultured Massilia sp.]
MTSLPHRHLALASALLLAAFLLVLCLRGFGDTSTLLVASSLLMAGCCWASAARLLGPRAALRLLLAGVAIGWVAEELGATRGWFFGDYTYTDVLGPRLGAVPVVIPLMWFALSYCGYVIADLVVWQAPSARIPGLPMTVLSALVGATVVTCYDLGVDPYMVYKLRAWTMARTDGWWFGETVQGFAGWMTVAFAIQLAFRLWLRRQPATATATATAPATTRHVLVPLSVYAGLMLFQVCLGYPVEARTIALFAMGFPLLTAGCGLLRWRAAGAAPAAGATLKEAA